MRSIYAACTSNFTRALPCTPARTVYGNCSRRRHRHRHGHGRRRRCCLRFRIERWGFDKDIFHVSLLPPSISNPTADGRRVRPDWQNGAMRFAGRPQERVIILWSISATVLCVRTVHADDDRMFAREDTRMPEMERTRVLACICTCC